MISFLVGLITSGILLYLAIIFESATFTMLGLIEALFVVLSFLILIVHLHSVRAKVSIPISIAEKGKPFNVHIVVNNSMPFGYRRMKFLVVYGNSMRPKNKKLWLEAKHIPRGESEFRYVVRIDASGNFEMGVKKIKVYDYLGAFHLTRRMKGAANALVLPEINAVPLNIGERVRNFYGETESFDELRPGFEPSETFGVREYRPGDKPSNVHWKLSAKVDDLMIREGVLPKACAVILFLNMDRKNYDSLLDKAVGMSFSLMDGGCAHFVAWYSISRNDVIRTRVDDEESFYLFLVNYMQDCSPKATLDLVDRYREKYRGERGVYEFIFEGGHITKNGDILTQSDFEEMVIN